MRFFSKGLKNEIETVVVNEPFMNVRATEGLLYILLETRIGYLNDLVSDHCISDLLHYSKGIFMLNARVLNRIFMTKGILFPHK